MNNKDKKINLLKTMVESIENINLYMEAIVNKLYEGDEKIACEGLAFISEELQWIFKGLDITSDIFDSNDIATNILEQLTEIVSAMENEDYILVADMLNYEVKPLLEELIKSIKETI